MKLASLAVLLLLAAGCGGEDEEPEASSPSTSSTTPSSTTTPPAPEPSTPSAPTEPTIDLAAACKEFAAGWIGDVTKKAYKNDGELAQSLADRGDADVQTLFGPVATIALSAVGTIGTFDYLDDEAAYDGAITRLNSRCDAVGFPIFKG